MSQLSRVRFGIPERLQSMTKGTRRRPESTMAKTIVRLATKMSIATISILVRNGEFLNNPSYLLLSYLFAYANINS